MSRDPGNSGFKLGITEYDRLIYKIKLCEKQNHFLFCPNVSVVKTVEDFLMRRWNLYKNIIYHHRVIKTDYLLQNVIIKAAEDFFNKNTKDTSEKESDTSEKESNTSYILPYDISGLWKANKELVSGKENSYALSQWNDAWLVTILKKSYFERYIDEESYLHDQLEEFLTNKKNYFSLIKRKEEFQEIDLQVSKIISKRKEELEREIKALRAHTPKEKERIFDIEGYLSVINEVIELAEEHKDSNSAKHGGFILCTIKKKIFGVDLFSNIIERVMEELKFEQGELLYAEKEPTTGTSKDLYFYQETKGADKFVSLDEISNISNVLQEDLKYSPFLFIYINKKCKKDEYTKEELRKIIGECMGNCIVEHILGKLQKFQ